MSQHNYFLGNSGKLIKFDAHKTPEFKEKRSVDWMLYGTDEDWGNRYPDYLIHLYNSSPKNNTIINEKCNYTVGQGLTYDDLDLDRDNKVEVMSYLRKIADNDVFPRSVKDRAIQGGFANEMIFNKKGDKVVPHHVDFSHIRVSKPEWDDKEGRYKDPVYYYTSDWNCRKPMDNPDFTEFLPFKWGEPPIKGKRYLYYYRDYRPNLGIYPLPEYLSCVPYIAADYEVSNFTYNNVKNGFSAGYLVNFYNGEPDENAKREITDMYNATLHGTDNAGKSVLSFNEDKDSGVEVTPINPNGQDDRFINLNNSIRDEIYTGHGVDPVIVGLKGDNGFNNNADEKRTAIEGWQNSYVDTIQGIFEDYFTSILHYNNLGGKVKVLKKEPIAPAMSEQLMQVVLDKNEIRKMYGHEPIKETVTNTTTTEKMSQDDQLVRMFNDCGVYDDELIVLKEREEPIFSSKDAFNKEKEFKQEFINQTEINVLKMLISGSSPNEIQKSIKITKPEYIAIIESLEEQGFLADGEPTSKGEKEAKKNEVFVVYKYVKRSDVSGPAIIETTRPFCKNLIRMSANRSWTIEDINRMNNGMGLDVFTSRGGWRTIEGTNKHVPFCRHVWSSLLVRRK